MSSANQFGPDGPALFAFAVVETVVERQDFHQFWDVTDGPLKIALVQAFLWANRGHPWFGGDGLDDLLARTLAGEQPLWRAFEETQLRELLEHWGPLHARGLGAAEHPRPIGPDLEQIVLIPTGGELVIVNKPTEVREGIVFTLRRGQGGWAVAGLTSGLPTPGWPPTFEFTQA